jgi:hypothetical protein
MILSNNNYDKSYVSDVNKEYDEYLSLIKAADVKTLDVVKLIFQLFENVRLYNIDFSLSFSEELDVVDLNIHENEFINGCFEDEDDISLLLIRMIFKILPDCKGKTVYFFGNGVHYTYQIEDYDRFIMKKKEYLDVLNKVRNLFESYDVNTNQHKSLIDLLVHYGMVTKCQSDEECCICLNNKCEIQFKCRHQACSSCFTAMICKNPYLLSATCHVCRATIFNSNQSIDIDKIIKENIDPQFHTYLRHIGFLDSPKTYVFTFNESVKLYELLSKIPITPSMLAKL